MSRISFPCQNPNPCPKTFSVSVEHVGRSANCPICGFQNTVLSAETIALNNELSKIESELAECENKIKDGRLSVAVAKRRIQGIADPNEIMAWINAGNVEKIEAYKKATLLAGEINTIDIKRLSELGHQYPNNSRVIQLGNRAADCHLELSKINLTASEELGGPDSSVLLNGTKDLLSTMFPHWRPKTSAPPVISRPEPIQPVPPIATELSMPSVPVPSPIAIPEAGSNHNAPSPFTDTVDTASQVKTFNTYFTIYWVCVVVGLISSVFFIGILVLLTAVVFQLMLLYQLWKFIPRDIARTTPARAVCFLLIPLFNLYWIFVAYRGLGKDMNKLLQQRGIQYKVDEILGLVYCLLWLIPFAQIATPIVLIFFLKSVKNGAIALLEQKEV